MPFKIDEEEIIIKNTVIKGLRLNDILKKEISEGLEKEKLSATAIIFADPKQEKGIFFVHPDSESYKKKKIIVQAPNKKTLEKIIKILDIPNKVKK